MEFQPIPDDTDRPLCFGLDYDPKDRRCRACTQQQACKPIAARWDRAKSLAEALAAAEADLRVGERRGEEYRDAVAIYMHLCRRWLGTDIGETYRKKYAPNIERARFTCEQAGVPFHEFVTAQLRTYIWLKQQPQGARMPKVMPATWLTGPKAMGRYENARRMYVKGMSGTIESGVVGIDALAAKATEAEISVGAYYVAAYVSNDQVRWEEAREHSEINPEWEQLFDVPRSLEKEYGRDNIERAQNVVHLRAAVTVVERYNCHLPNRVGVREFSWGALARLMHRLYAERVPASPIDLPERAKTLRVFGA